MRWTLLPLRWKLFATHAAISLSVILAGALAAYELTCISLTDRAFRQLESVRALKTQDIRRQLEDWIERLDKSPLTGNSQDLKRLFSAEDFLEGWIAPISQSTKLAVPSNVISRASEKTQLVESLRGGTLSFWLVRKTGESLTAVHLSSKSLDRYLTDRPGLGETGETYIVGTDHLIRTDSRFFPAPNALQIKVNTEAVNRAFSDGSGVLEIPDYRGVPVLSAFTRLRVGTIDWAILSEIDVSEVHLPFKEMARAGGILLAVTLALILFVSGWLSARLATPIQINRFSLYEGQELERGRIARELHDGVGQLLSATLLKLTASEIEPETRRKLHQSIDEVLIEIRNISSDLSSQLLANFGLVPALRQLTQDTGEGSGIQIELQIDPAIDQNPPTLSVSQHLFRISQEALHNLVRHSSAKVAKLDLRRRGEWIELVIEDDGQGFPNASTTRLPKLGGHGLNNIRDRVESLGGVFTMGSGSSTGARLEIRVPWHTVRER